jgi:hypothetical protein
VQQDAEIQHHIHSEVSKAVLPKLFSTATQFSERRFIATQIALLYKKGSSKKKNFNYLLLNIILQKKVDLFLIMRLA